MIAQHSSATNEHYTPEIVVEPARKLLGAFDLDPASCVEANERVKASRIYTITDDGLAQPWRGRVFLNPPGGKLKMVGDRWVAVKAGPGKSSMQIWWDKLAREWLTGNVTEAFFIAFTLEILRTSQSCALPVQAFPRCYPSERLPFRGDAPTHANVLVYLPRRDLWQSAYTIDHLRKYLGQIGLCEAGGWLNNEPDRFVP